MSIFSKLVELFNKKNSLMLIISFIFALGVITYFNQNIAIIIASVFTLFTIIFLLTKIYSVKKILLITLAFYAGFILSYVKIKGYDDLVIHAPDTVTISGTISSVPTTIKNSKYKFFLQTNKIDNKEIKAKTLVTIKLKDSDTRLNIGDNIKIKGKLRLPLDSTNPSQFDYSKYLKNFNTFTVIYCDNNDVKYISKSDNFKWKVLNKLNKTRNTIISNHAKFLKSPNLEILGGIVFGDDAISPPEYIKNSFINSGLLHILAASGMNVAFIFSFWFFILKCLKIPYKSITISGMIVVILYTLMTGLGASVIRASIMLLFVLIGKLLNRDAHSLALLSFVGLIMLIYNPAYINNVSFQLSFVATFGLLFSTNIISSKIKHIPNIIKMAFLIPFIAQVWVAPIQMFYFNTFSLYSIFANISTVHLISAISFGGFISSILSTIPIIGIHLCHIFDFILNYLINILIFISNFFANLKYSLIETSHPSLWQIAVYYISIISITLLIKYDKFKYALLNLFITGLILSLTLIHVDTHKLEIIAFDVQNADSFLIKTPQNKYFMIDTGKMPFESGNSQAKIIMLKYLKDRGIKTLDGLIITHFDNDHSGGATTILENLKVNTLYLNSSISNTETGKQILSLAKENHQTTQYINSSKIIYLEPDLKITLYKSNLKNKYSDNENSIITLITYKNFDSIFMGDAGIKAYNKLQNNFPQNVEVLKVGHHGGKQVVNKQMIDKLNIQTSIISTGLNHFGHPNKGTLDTLRNTEILRTDFNNSIKITTNGNSYDVLTFNTHNRQYELKNKHNCK